MARESKTSAAHTGSARVAGRPRIPPDAARRRLAALSRATAASIATDAPPGRGTGVDDGGAADAVSGPDGPREVHPGGEPAGAGKRPAATDAPDSGRRAEREDPPGDSKPAWAAGLAHGGAWGALAERWVPEPLREARIDPGKRGAVLLCTVAALAALVAAVGVWLARPAPEPVGAPQAGSAAGDSPMGPSDLTAVTGAAGTDGAPGALDGRSGSSAVGAGFEAESGADPGARADVAAADEPDTADDVPPGPILVSVTGRVRKPGLVSVPADARVADAIDAAGGVADLALLTGMNLAAHLTDGASVVVGGPDGNAVVAEAVDDPGGGATVSAGARPALIDINTADSATLQQLSGVGPVTAEAIIAYRTQHGPFTELSQLQEVSGIGPATYARLAPHVGL